MNKTFGFICALFNIMLNKSLCTLVCVVFLFHFDSFAQVDKVHYLPPTYDQSYAQVLSQIVLTTYETTPFDVLLSYADGTTYTAVGLSKTNPLTVPRTISSNYDGLILGADNKTNKALDNEGIILTASKDYYVNQMHVVTQQGDIITSKGATVGLGTDFYSGHVYSKYPTGFAGAIACRSHFISVMASEDNTTVTFDNPRVTWQGQPNTFSTTLNKGQSYVVAAPFAYINTLTGADKFNAYNGTHVTSDKPISMNSGSFLASFSDQGAQDAGFDQTIPVKYARNEFVLIKGQGTDPNMETAMVVATADNTQIFLNGSTTASYTINKGEYAIIPGSNFIANVMNITTSQPVLVYQTTVGIDNYQNLGMMLVPGLSESATHSVQIANVNVLGDLCLYVTTKVGSTVTINGKTVTSSPLTTTGNANWVSYKITTAQINANYCQSGNTCANLNMNGTFIVESTGPMNAAVTTTNGTTGAAGYYSGFSIPKIIAGVGTFDSTSFILPCEQDTVSLLASGAFSYTWSSPTGDMDLVSQIKPSTLFFTKKATKGEGPFKYKVAMQSYDFWGLIKKDTLELSITVKPTPTVTATSKSICSGESTVLNGSGAISYVWDNAIFDNTSFTPTQTQIYTVTGTGANGCMSTATATVTVKALPTVSATDQYVQTGLPATLNGMGAQSYVWDGGITDNVAFTPSSAQKYTVTGTAANGCSNTATAQVVISNPGFPLTGTQKVCYGYPADTLHLVEEWSTAAASTNHYIWEYSEDSISWQAMPLMNDKDYIYSTDNIIKKRWYRCTITNSNGLDLLNTGFETLTRPLSGWDLFTENEVPGWHTTESDGLIEIWNDVDMGIPAIEGKQSAELNANFPSRLYQYVYLTKGQTISWSFSHRGRDGTDHAQLNIYSFDGKTKIIVLKDAITDNTAWATYSGTWTVTLPDGYYQYSFEAIATASGNLAAGNELDGVHVPVSKILQMYRIDTKPLPTITANAPTICYGESTQLTGVGASSYEWSDGITDNQAFTPTATQTYIVTGTATNGCLNTASTLVTVNVLPTVSAVSPSICLGASTFLTGTGANSYVWDNIISDKTSFTPTQTQTYSVTGIDGNGCQNTASATVTVNALPTIKITSLPTICYGQSTKLQGSGANSYLWDGNITDNTNFNPETTTIYTVTGTDGNGCQNTASATVTVNALPTIKITSIPTICYGQSTKLQGSGANSYLWNGNITENINFSPAKTTVYTVTGTDGNGCQNTASATVTVNVLPTIKITSIPTICYGQSTKLQGNGANSYLWDGNITDNTNFSPTTTTIYTVTGTDGNGCQNTASATVTVNALPTIKITSIPTICYGQSTKLQGSGANSYIWDGNITDNTNFSPTTTTIYNVTGTDGNGCQNTATVTVTVNALPTPVITSNDVDNSICFGNTLHLDAGSYKNYEWSNLQTTASIAITQVQINSTYTVTVTDNNNCSNSASTNITIYDNPVVDLGSDRSFCADSIVLITANQNMDSYLWNTAETTPSIKATNTQDYSITVTKNGCTGFDSVHINVSASTSVDLGTDKEMCIGDSIQIGPGAGYDSYVWNDGSTNFYLTAYSAGTYSLTVTSGLCQATDSISISTNPLPTPIISSSDSDNKICDGESVLFDAGVYSSYTWQNLASTETITVKNHGQYNVTVTDAKGCKNVATTNLIVYSLPTISAVSQTVCFNDSTKLIGIGANSFNWSDGIFDNTTFLPTSTHTFTVIGTDGNGCSNTASATVTVNILPTITGIAAPTEICVGDFSTISASGATSYKWNTIVGKVYPSSTTTYYVTGTDGNGCQNTASTIVTVHDLPNVTAFATPDIICFGQYSTINATGAKSYDWNQTAGSVSPSSSTTYYVTGTDGNGCTNTSSVLLTINQLPLVTTNPQTICYGDSTKLAGIGASSYIWDGGIFDNKSFLPTSTQTFTVTGTDGNSCSNTSSTTVTVNALPTVSAKPQTVCYGQSTQLSGSGANLYIWDNGIFDNISFTPTSTTTFNVTGTDANGCKNIASATVFVNLLPNVTVQSPNVCIGQSTKLSANGAVSYIWDGGITNNITFTPTATKSYTVTGTDSNGCKNTALATITVNQLPTPIITTNDADNTICFGNSLTLNAGNFKKYEWSNQQTTSQISITQVQINATYTVTVTDLNDCVNAASTVITINDNPIIDLGPDRSFCADSIVLISASPNMDSYIWNTSETTKSIQLTKTQVYSVTVTKNGCTGSDFVNINVSSSISADLGIDKEICAGDSIQIGPGSGYDSYLWNDGSTKFFKYIKDAGMYSVTVTSKLCKAKDFIKITQNSLPSPVITSSDADNSICAGESVTFNAGTYAGYTWQNNATTQTITGNNSGKYTVTVTDLKGCKNAASTELIVNQLPTISANSPTICRGESAILSGTGAQSYIWNNGIFDNTIFYPTISNIFTVTGTDANGCKNTASTTVTVNQLPAVITNSQSVCAGHSTVLKAYNAESYVWDGGIKDNIPFTPSSTKDFNVTGTDLSGCSNTSSANVVVNPLPTITGISSPEAICIGEYATLSAIGAFSYEWNTPTSAVTPKKTTTYYVTGTDINGCKNISEVTVVVNPLPTIIALANPSIVCLGSSTVLSATGANSYQWSTKTEVINPIISTKCYVTGTSIDGCVNTDSIDIKVAPVPVVKLFGDSIICENTTKVPYWIIPEDTTHSINWTVTGNRTMYSVESGKKFDLYKQIDWIHPGFDTIRISEFNGMCYGYDSLPIKISPHAQPAFYWEINSETNDILFTNTTNNPLIEGNEKSKTVDFNYFIWNFGRENDVNVNQSNESYLNDSIIQERYKYGYYDVKLISVNDYCIDSITKKVFLDLQEALYIPNSFQPESNNLGLAHFLPKGFNLATYKISIYDMWGNLIWYSDKLINGKPAEGWDGTSNGTTMKLDTYIWKVSATFLDGSTWEGQASSNNSKKNTFGNILLLR